MGNEARFGTGEQVRAMTFEQLLERCRWYIKKVSRTWAGDHPYSGEEDIFQELSICLWRCYEKNRQEPVTDFHAFFVQAVANQIATHYRVKQLAHDKEVVRMDAAQPETKGGRNSDPYPVVRNEESEDFYRAGIFELITALTPKTAKVVMESLDKNNRGPMSGRNQAYLEVKNVLDGNR